MSTTPSKKTALLVCPGRGTYGKEELGYLARHHGDKSAFIASIDTYRKAQGQIPVSELDAAQSYSLAMHTRGDNASALIFACAYADYLSIDRDAFDIVAVCGNSMGWYIAPGCASALAPDASLQVVNTMGTLMQDASIGGQLLYPLVDDNWQPVPGRREMLVTLMADINDKDGHELYISIELGGMLVFAGNDPALEQLASALPPEQGRFPLRLHNHAAFHTPLQAPVSEQGKSAIAAKLFHAPAIPLIDGRGALWHPGAVDPQQLWHYTLGAQVVEPYDFTASIRVGLREFAPDCVIILGPGGTLGGGVAQSMIEINWQGLASKQDFIDRQSRDPLVISMGRDDQRARVIM